MTKKLSTKANKVKHDIQKHAPEILLCTGVLGWAATSVMAAKATPKALLLLEEKKEELGVDELTTVEKVQAAWKPYIPAVATGVLSTACIIGANTEYKNRLVGAATAYKFIETAYDEFKDKTKEIVGEGKVKEIREKIAEEKIAKNPVPNSQVYIPEGDEILCYEAMSGRYFKATKHIVDEVEIELNRQLIDDFYTSLNVYFTQLGLEPTDIGNDLGWNLDQGKLKFEYDAVLTPDGKPCLAISCNIRPKYDYYKYM